MGRNGTERPIFSRMVDFINGHVGETVGQRDILLGAEPGNNVTTAYLYKLIRLGYVEVLDGAFVKDRDARFRIVKPTPVPYYGPDMRRELRQMDGYIQ